MLQVTVGVLMLVKATDHTGPSPYQGVAKSMNIELESELLHLLRYWYIVQFDYCDHHLDFICLDSTL